MRTHDPHKDGKFRIHTKRRKVVDQEFHFKESYQFPVEAKRDLFDRLHAMAKEHLIEMAKDGRGIKDFEYYFMEEGMQFMFGEEIFRTMADIRDGWDYSNL